MKDKPVVALGVTGGIAAYKAAELCRLLKRRGYEVRVVMTENACRFVTPLTFRTLSQYPVMTSLWETPEWRPEHVALADEAALLVIAPCTANCLGKLAGGIADDALSTLGLTFGGPVVVAPAMNPGMWRNPAVQQNVEVLKSRGVRFVGPADGDVACGAAGTGRMAEPEEIASAVIGILEENGANGRTI
ncbi:MAG: phosphopantothenoylcysteine decarboxylase [Lentisphaeria bacterium]|nr:phosphopantothenoylcysteine decarboxylase [Lentisphaeria bacterium]